MTASAAPPGATVHGHQTDGAGDVFLAVAHTPEGEIPAKAIGNTAWYPYGGKEHTTNNFSWVSAPGSQLVPAGTSSQPPSGALQIGFQKDGAGALWAAIAHTPQGDIPAKAIGNTAWYPHGGVEHTTNSFSWVVVKTE